MKKIVGYILLSYSTITWIIISTLPFFNISIIGIVKITTLLIITGEISFIISIILLGKEAWIKIKNYFTTITKIKKD